MPPYVGMARKQNGGYHGSISVQTPIFHLVVNSTRLKTLRSAVWRCPKLYIILKSVQKRCLSLVHNESQSLATRPSRRGKSFTIRRNAYAARRDAVKRMFFFCRVTRREDRTWFYFLRRVAAQSLRLIVN